MAVVIISRDHIGLPMVCEFFSCSLIVCLFVGEHTRARANVLANAIDISYAGVHDSLFVEANADCTGVLFVLVDSLLVRW